MRRTVTDLNLANGAGRSGLDFTRFSRSRWFGGVHSRFGTGGNWRHNYFWHIIQSGDNEYGPVFLVNGPTGEEYYYYKDSPGALHFIGGADHQERILQSGSDTNQFYLMYPKGERYAFYRSSAGVYQVQGLYDAHENFYAFTYDDEGRFLQVTDPITNHWIRVLYGVPTNFTAPGRIAFEWVDTNATSVVVGGTWNGWKGIDTLNAVQGSPAVSGTPPSGQNNVGDRFDFNTNGGPWRTTLQGGFGTLGEIYVNYDATNLYIGGVGANMTGSNNAMIVFLGFDTLTDNATNLWDKSGLPNGLDYLHNINFHEPMDMAILLGDEYGDATHTNFNLGSGYDFGQGVYYTAASAFHKVTDARISQFDGAWTNATTSSDDDGNREMDRWEVAIPWGSLNATGIASLGECYLSGILASDGISDNNRYISGNYLGSYASGSMDSFTNYGFNALTLYGVAVGLPGTNFGHPVIMADSGEGVWTGSVCLGEGTYEYKFYVNGSNWVRDTNNPHFNAANMSNSLLWVAPEFIVAVTASDGRVVSYEYDGMFVDSIGHGAVKRALYGDGTYGEYFYSHPATGKYWRPMMVGADDPMFPGRGSRVSYSYQHQETTSSVMPFGISGMLYEERHLYTDQLIARFEVDTCTWDKSTVEYASGAKETFKFSNPDYGPSPLKRYTNAVGDVYRYDHYNTNGMLNKVIDAKGRETTYGRTLHFGVITSVVDHAGGVSLTYYTDPEYPVYVASNVDQLGRATHYTYDGSNRLVRTDYPDGTHETWSYNRYGQVLAHTLQDGAVWSNTYDDLGRLVAETDPLGNTETYGYDSMGLLCAETNALGFVTRHFYNWRGEITNRVYADGTQEKWWYDKYGQLTSQVSRAGGMQSYTYDEWGQLVSEKDPLGAITAFTYDADGRRVTTIHPSGLVVSNVYDGVGRKIREHYSSDGTYREWQYDADGIRTQINRLGLMTRYTYDAAGRLQSAISPEGRTKSYSYDLAGNPTHITNAAGDEMILTYDKGNRLATFWDCSGTLSSNRYDAAGRLASRADEVGTVHEYVYDSAGRITMVNRGGQAVESNLYNAVGSPQVVWRSGGHIISNDFDGVGRIAAAYAPDGTHQDYTYSNGYLTAYSDRLGRVEKFQRNVLGWTMSATDASGFAFDYAHDVLGHVTNLVDKQGYARAFSFDEEGHLLSLRYADGSTVQFSSNAEGQLLTRADGEGRTASFSHDGDGYLTNINYAVDADINFSYDALGRPTKMVDGVGTTAFIYACSRGAPDQSSGPFAGDAIGYGYDIRNRLTNLTVGSVSVRYSYDGLDRITSVVAPEGQYDFAYLGSSALITELARPNGTVSTYAYDGLLRLTSVVHKTTSGSNLCSFAYTYNAGDQIVRITRETGRYIDCGYDEIGQLVSALGRKSDGTPRPGYSFRYEYNPMGDLTNREHNGFVTATRFNALHQNTTSSWSGAPAVLGTVNVTNALVAVEGVPAVVFSDGTFAATNIAISVGSNTWDAVITDPFGRSATSTVSVVAKGASYQYDRCGHLTNDGVRAYAFDERGLLTQVKDAISGALIMECRYDGLGRRKERILYQGASPSTNRYVYHDWLVVAVLDGSNDIVETYVHGPDKSGQLGGAGGIGGLLSVTMHGTGDRYWHHDDGRGNVACISDGNGHVAASYEYAPFGDLLTGTGSFRSRFLYSSKELDAACGLYNFGLRHYSPSMSRWIQRDPLDDSFGVLRMVAAIARMAGYGCMAQSVEAGPSRMDPYRYAHSDPFSGHDPLGLDIVAAGGMRCEGGQIRPWVGPQKCDTIKSCMYEHEQQHVIDYLKESGNPCGAGSNLIPLSDGSEPKFWGDSRVRSECNSYNQELRCLRERKKSSCKPDPTEGRKRTVECLRDCACSAPAKAARSGFSAAEHFDACKKFCPF